MAVLLWIVSLVLTALCVLIAIYNNTLAWQQFVRQRDDGRGFFPIFGGWSGAIAILIVPIGSLNERLLVSWIPLVLDFGVIPYLVLTIIPR